MGKRLATGDPSQLEKAINEDSDGKKSDATPEDCKASAEELAQRKIVKVKRHGQKSWEQGSGQFKLLGSL